jgi:lipopolysaccharide export LptBFGC system permease protein LptF
MTMLPAFLIYVFYILALGAVRGRIENDKLFFSGEIWLVHFIFFLVAIGLIFGSDYWNSIRYRLAKN